MDVNYLGETGFYDPSSNKRLGLNKGSVPSVDHDHKVTHESNMFLGYATMTATTAGAVRRFIINVPTNDSYRQHAKISVDTSVAATVRIRKNVAITGATVWAATSNYCRCVDHNVAITGTTRSAVKIFSLTASGAMCLAATQSGQKVLEAKVGVGAYGDRGIIGQGMKPSEFILGSGKRYLVTVHAEASSLKGNLTIQHSTEAV
jgi:hypothetical protein